MSARPNIYSSVGDFVVDRIPIDDKLPGHSKRGASHVGNQDSGLENRMESRAADATGVALEGRPLRPSREPYGLDDLPAG